jgi:hypothetical protein
MVLEMSVMLISVSGTSWTSLKPDLFNNTAIIHGQRKRRRSPLRFDPQVGRLPLEQMHLVQIDGQLDCLMLGDHRTKPATIRRSVDFPHPEGPTPCL